MANMIAITGIGLTIILLAAMFVAKHFVDQKLARLDAEIAAQKESEGDRPVMPKGAVIERLYWSSHGEKLRKSPYRNLQTGAFRFVTVKRPTTVERG